MKQKRDEAELKAAESNDEDLESVSGGTYVEYNPKMGIVDAEAGTADKGKLPGGTKGGAVKVPVIGGPGSKPGQGSQKF